MIVLIMGVAGSGKTTAGTAVAARLGWRFVDADDYHFAANLAMLRAGLPLTDGDRRPWLERLAVVIAEARQHEESLALACSALKRSYRDLILGRERGDVLLVHLVGDPALIASRMSARTHFMPPSSLPQQLATLEPPTADERPLTLDAAVPLDALVDRIFAAAT
ncbi:MAG TPA: gluconokinase [Dehalococcoidia bacterium]|nr:gluconokinase [Dehalococcoidia bacterium]